MLSAIAATGVPKGRRYNWCCDCSSPRSVYPYLDPAQRLQLLAYPCIFGFHGEKGLRQNTEMHLLSSTALFLRGLEKSGNISSEEAVKKQA